MSCSVVKCSNCHFAWTVLSDVWLIMGWINFRQDKWSTKMVAYLYCLIVSLHLSWAMKPSLFDCICLIKMHKLAFVMTKIAHCLSLSLVFCHCTKHAACAFGRLDLGQSPGDISIFGQNLEIVKWEVAEAIMPSHQLSLVIVSLHMINLSICIGERSLGRVGEIANFIHRTCRKLLHSPHSWLPVGWFGKGW